MQVGLFDSTLISPVYQAIKDKIQIIVTFFLLFFIKFVKKELYVYR